jgi:BRCT domain type II-containing protein
MTEKKLAAGDHITSKCSKCKDSTNHTIVAMVEDKVVRVQCNICNGTHNYRNPTAKKKATSTASKSSSVKKTKAEANWQELVSAAANHEVKPYSMQAAFKNADFIQHPTFGLGQVINTIAPNKMEIQFEDGIKMLRCKLK